MTEFTLKPIEEKTIRINYYDDSFELPLQASLNFEEANMLASPEGTYAFMKKHVPEHIMKTIKIEEDNAILAAYREASEKNSGKTLGER